MKDRDMQEFARAFARYMGGSVREIKGRDFDDFADSLDDAVVVENERSTFVVERGELCLLKPFEDLLERWERAGFSHPWVREFRDALSEAKAGR